MASLSDVQNAMASVIQDAVYPDGIDESSIAQVPIIISAGDFQKQDLDEGLAGGSVFINIFAINGMTRSTTRFKRAFVDPIKNTPTLVLTVYQNTVTVGGTITVGEAALIIVNKTAYSVKVQLGSTLNTIAESLSALISDSSVIDNVITINNTYRVQARVSVQGTARQILFSHEGMFRVRIFAPNHALRELVGNAIEIGFGLHGYYLTMPDDIKASIKPNKVSEVNPYELSNAFIRDYVYLVEYHTVYVKTFQSIGAINIDVEVD